MMHVLIRAMCMARAVDPCSPFLHLLTLLFPYTALPIRPNHHCVVHGVRLRFLYMTMKLRSGMFSFICFPIKFTRRSVLSYFFIERIAILVVSFSPTLTFCARPQRGLNASHGVPAACSENHKNSDWPPSIVAQHPTAPSLIIMSITQFTI